VRFGTWIVKSLYRSGSLTTVARKLSSYRLDVVGVQEVERDKGLVYDCILKIKMMC
jgi:hypothetical protein